MQHTIGSKEQQQALRRSCLPVSAAQAHLAGQVDACGHDACGVVLQAAALDVEALEEQQRRVLQEAAAAAAEVAAKCCSHNVLPACSSAGLSLPSAAICTDGDGTATCCYHLSSYTTPLQLLQLDCWCEQYATAMVGCLFAAA
jgi:hypothetical protein